MGDKREHRNGEIRVEKLKKNEKSASEPQTEYLNMDTDEEEFGRQETPEPEDEEPLEPDKPIFTDEELNTLVKYVTDLTILPSLSEFHWNEECCKIIKEYFHDPKKIILTIFFDENELRTSLDFPVYTKNGLTYFLRYPWQVYNAENFLSTVIFGNVNKSTEKTLLKFMECTYAPVVFNSNEWLYNVVYKPMGLTILYIPREGMDIKKSKSSTEILDFKTKKLEKEVIQEEGDEKELNNRLEKIARTWIKQIREALIALPMFNKQLRDIRDEFDYWNHKYDNLSCLLCQMTSVKITTIVKKLKNLGSTSIKQFYPFLEEIKIKVEEASVNISYLNILLEACNKIQEPGDVEIHVSKIILLLRFIQVKSPFFAVTENIETLHQALSVRIINFCKEYVDLQKVFQGKAAITKKMTEICISSCKRYSEIYDQIANECIEQDENWDVNTENVFKNVDAFINRCKDVVEICNATVVFNGISTPIMFGGSKGKVYDLYYQKLQNSFAKILEDIREPFNFALDITNISWFQFILEFRYKVSELENMLINMIDDMFEEVENVDEGIEALYSLQKFKQRPDLENLLNDKWMEVWKIFSREIKFCNSAAFENEDSNKLNLNINIMYLRRQYLMMINASDWIGDCDIQRDILKIYKDVIRALSAKENQ